MSASDSVFYKRLLVDTLELLPRVAHQRCAIVGDPTVIRALATDLKHAGLLDRVVGFFVSDVDRPAPEIQCVTAYSFANLVHFPVDLLVVAADGDKEDYILAIQPYIVGAPKTVVAGYDHFEFRDATYHGLVKELEHPSLANGYPSSRIHLYQCLENAARLDLQGVVAEFGMFRGGTTMFLAKTIRQLARTWPIYGFDTFSGFPDRVSFLDMYDHEDLAVVDLEEVRRYLAPFDVTIVPGDLRQTVDILADKPVVLAFVDTDNYTSACAALEVITNQIVPGGAMVFDHLTGVDRFVYTLGERLAAKQLLGDPRFFNLHGTGVFIRQPT